MKRIFSSPNLIAVTQLKHTLEGAGVSCFIRNEISAGLAPEIPLNESTPELWIEDDDKLGEAEQIKQDWQACANVVGSAWTCPGCGEVSAAEFTSCWKCGTIKS